MASPRETIFNLNEKVAILAEAIAVTSNSGNSSRASFARSCGINEKSLTSACNAGKMAPAMQAIVAKYVGFSLENPTWIDHRIPVSKRHLTNLKVVRQDTADKFRNYLFPHLGLSSIAQYQILSEVPVSKHAEFASVAVTDYGQRTAEGSELYVHLQASLSPGYLDDGIAFGFKKISVRMSFHKRGHLRLCGRLASEGPALIGNVTVISRGTDSEPFWEIRSPAALIQGDISTTDEPLARLLPMDVPAGLTVTLSAHMHDGSLWIDPKTDNLSTNKQRVIERLMALMIDEEVRLDGSIALSKQSVAVTFSKDD